MNQMGSFFLLAILGLPILIAGDLSWLGYIAHDFYFESLGGLARAIPNWYAVVAFYIVYIVGLTFFATYPAWKAKSFQRALILGGFFGFVAYATYDLTNLATLYNWPLLMSYVDMAWGAFLGAVVSGLSYSILKHFSPHLA